MGLMAAMQAITAVEREIAIDVQVGSQQVKQKIKRAYVVTPPKGTLNDLPCFLNRPETANDEGGIGGRNQMLWTVTTECVVYDADWDRAALIAMAFYDATYARFLAEKPASMRFGGTVSHFAGLRTPSRADFLYVSTWAEKSAISFSLELDIELFQDPPYGGAA